MRDTKFHPMGNELKRCWHTSEPLYTKYHDEEWGVPLHDDQEFFEFLILESFQAGLSWWLILQRRENLREAFDGFNPKKMTSYTAEDVERLMNASGMIRNRAKIRSAINNACCFLKIQQEFGSFDNFVWKFVGGRPSNNAFAESTMVPSGTTESRTMSRELKKMNFQFMGPTICYAFMQATGLVNDHLIGCFRHNEIRELQRDLIEG